MERGDFEQRLEALLGRLLPGFRRLQQAQRLTGGASQETWRLLLETRAGEMSLCLRRSAGAAGAVERDNLAPAAEAALIVAATRAGVPEPDVIGVLEPGDELGEGFLMQWLEGETLGGRIAHSTRFESTRPQLARQCGEILGRIHSIDPAEPGVALASYTPAELVQATWQQYRDFESPQPMLDFTARWLLDNLPADTETGLVHGDFRNGNLMVSADRGVVGVLDWELASIGDPVRDLGWVCVNSWRFGRVDLPVGGFGTVADLLAGYRSTSGRDIDPGHLNFWVVFGSFWWSVVCLRMAHSYRCGENSSVERPAIGRRASEGQADCAAMLIPGPAAELPQLALRRDELPGLGELVGSVAEFVTDTVVGQLDGATAYLARVAANSLAIARRQAELGPALERAETGRLRELLAADGDLEQLRWQLVESLRGGMSLDTPGLALHLRSSVQGQLSIDQPTYQVTPGLPG